MSNMENGLMMIVTAFALIIIAFMLGMDVGGNREKSIIKKDAIIQGYAEYNSTNGIWQWKKNVIEK